jgi:hypothetical protein
MKRAPTEAEAILFMDDSSGSPVIMNGRRQSVAPWKLIDARPAPLSWPEARLCHERERSGFLLQRTIAALTLEFRSGIDSIVSVGKELF